MAPKQRDWSKLYIVMVLVGLACCYLSLLRPAIVGLWGDDAIYLMGAKSIATGQGYQLLSEPSNMAIIKYPPLFSALLAPVWMSFHEISSVLWASKLFVIGLGLASVLILYRLGRRFYQLSRAEASGLCLLFGVNYIWLRCVTEVLSEPLFLLLIIGLVYAALRLEKKSALPHPREIGVLVLLSCLAFYTRTVGIAFMAGTALWLAKRYGRTNTYSYVGACTLLCLPWAWWTLAQPETIDMIHGFYVYPENQSYINEFFFAIIKSHGLLPILQDAGSQFPVAALFAAFPFLIDLPYLPQTPIWFSIATLIGLAGLALFGLYRLIASARVSLVAGCAWFYLALTFLWYSHGQYPRLVLCITPFLYLFLLAQLKRHTQTSITNPIARRAIVLGAPLLLIALNLWHPGLAHIPTGTTMAVNVRQAIWPEYQAAFSAIQRLTGPTDIIWSRYNGLYYLYTNRPIMNRNLIPGAETHMDWMTANQFQQFYEVLIATLQKNQVGYILLEPNFNSDMAVEVPEMTTDVLIRSMPARFTLVYASPHQWVRLYRFLPPKPTHP